MRRLALVLTASTAALIGTASAGIGVDASVSTAGLSGNVHFDVMPMVTLRGGINYLEYEAEDIEFDGVEYDTDLDFTQFGLYADLHPLPILRSFTITAGYVFGEREFEAIATPLEDTQIGDVTFTPEQFGSLIGNGSLGDSGFYGGLGFDSTTRGFIPISFVLRAGVIVSDSPEFSLRSEGGLADTDPTLRAQLDEEIAREVANINDEIEDFKFYPVISFGIGIGF
ncbi:MAG: hypothetical protein HRU11_00460 [Parvularculaceae bacterium]|nr:hypothetical protein [Parvularculaceae bacterium]